ncbi:uncharacterized protein fam83e isoform X2 [Mugil cephalus]|uniref:uncharacterized protein fam83e isoform X2 n=1 Tax=Mugil cephalus TaxID=48193 RepID=UPI001FB5858F|nr:uncharacterized protein fam83e isoform X2 [Mugil cephalus]
MSNSQEQSLNENVVFLPVDESCPEFLHSEREREAVERLLSVGPEAFYSCIGTERSGCFLSSEEVGQITSWAQSFHHSQAQEENGVEGNSETEGFCSTYFPSHTDLPVPDLELGWPDKNPWVTNGGVSVHTSPPALGDPPVREIIRRYLQNSRHVIAIVTDRLTDGPIISDLHNAASRGVPVYIILNQRSIQENFTFSRLRHPYIRVRVLGGKSFCSRTGRMVVGEMKENFVLIDLETVIHGSYSLTWTDAHLHRQLITVLRGPVVDSFDREFRTLFAASLPVPDTWRLTNTLVNVPHQLKDFSEIRFQKQLSLEHEVGHPPSPPADCLMDWEAMGVVNRDCVSLGSHVDEEIVVKEMQLQNDMQFNDRKTPDMDGLTYNEHQFVEKRRINENTSPETTTAPHKSAFSTDPVIPPTDPATIDRMKRVEQRIERAVSRQNSQEQRTHLHDRNTAPMPKLFPVKKREHTQREPILEEPEIRAGGARSKVENTPSSRRPIILRMPQSDSFSSLSDIMKRIQQGSSGLLKRPTDSVERTQSMMDLSKHSKEAHHEEKQGVPVPRFKTSYDPDHMTPALALMKKRNDQIKSEWQRSQEKFMPRERPRSSSFAALGMDWRRPITEKEEQQK